MMIAPDRLLLSRHSNGVTQRPNHLRTHCQTIPIERLPSHRWPPLASVKLISAIITCFLLILHVPSSSQQNACYGVCHCYEDNLEAICRQPFGSGLLGLPHILNPNTRHLVINFAHTSQLAGLDLLSKLESLDLSHNKLVNIDFEILNKNAQLKSFNASHNNIFELKDSLFTKTISELGFTTSTAFSDMERSPEVNRIRKLVKIFVTEFIANHNFISSIANFTFIRWPKLETLDLSFNHIQTLEPESLAGLGRLESINLRGNRLTQLPTVAFRNTLRIFTPISGERIPSLRIVDLGENYFKSIESNSLSSLVNAQKLYLDSCLISSIDNDAFRGLHTLHSLSLENNLLQEVPSKSLEKLGILRSLNIGANNFTKLEPASFKGNEQLEELHINNGSFRELPRGIFMGVSGLRRLEMSSNRNFVHIDPDAFEDLPNISHIILKSNGLSTLPQDLSKKRNLSLLDVRDNPLNCDCSLKWLTNWLKKINESIQPSPGSHSDFFSPNHLQSRYIDGSLISPQDLMLIDTVLNITCSGPPALSGKPILGLPDNKLECLEPSSELHLHFGFATLFLMTFALTFVCMMNFCRNKRHIFMMLKQNLVSNQLPVLVPYTHNIDKNVHDFRHETEFHSGGDYEPIDYGQTQSVYTVQNNQMKYLSNDPLQQFSLYEH